MLIKESVPNLIVNIILELEKSRAHFFSLANRVHIHLELLIIQSQLILI